MAVTNEQKIWDYLLNAIGNPYGAAGLMGNLYAESGLSPTNLQNTYEKKLGYTDATYTAAVDAGTYSKFANDSAGYGLAQWTYKTRKLNLLNFAKTQGKSIGDLDMQLQFLINELKGYTAVMNTLKTATSVKEASDIVLVKFENPADQSDTAKNKRASYGQGYYDKYAKTAASSTQSNTETAKGETTTMADYSKYINSTGTHYISNSGSDENKKYSGGKAGDQTGHEWELKAWYNRPWTHVFRYEKDPKVGETLAKLGCAAALNDNIGYDQGQRTTYWTELKKVGYDPSKIKTPCEEDCSAGVSSNVKACGYILGIKALQDVSYALTSRNTLSGLKAAGFTVYTASKYTAGSSYLLPGDILLYENHHVAMNITKGKNANYNGTTTTDSTGAPTAHVGSVIGVATALGNMNVRASADSTAKSLGTVSKGTKLEVLEVLSNGWYKVVYSKSSNGYGYTSNSTGKYYDYEAYATATVTPNTSNSSTSSDTVGVATALASMYLRTAPEAGAPTVGTVSKGTSLQVVEVLSNGWYKVKTDKTDSGFAYTSNSTGKYYSFKKNETTENKNIGTMASGTPKEKDATLAGTYKVTASSLNIRHNAGTDQPILIAIPKNTRVQTDGSYNSYNGSIWPYVTFEYKSIQMAGFCSINYLERV